MNKHRATKCPPQVPHGVKKCCKNIAEKELEKIDTPIQKKMSHAPKADKSNSQENTRVQNWPLMPAPPSRCGAARAALPNTICSSYSLANPQQQQITACIPHTSSLQPTRHLNRSSMAPTMHALSTCAQRSSACRRPTPCGCFPCASRRPPWLRPAGSPCRGGSCGPAGPA